MLNLLNQQYQFSLPLWAIIAVIVVFIAIYIYFVVLSRKLKTVQTPRYGFLGKPLMPVLMVAILGTGIFMINSGYFDQQTISIQAEKELSAEITSQVIENNSNGQVIEFKATPKINKINWGGDNTSKFDIYWNINGSQNFDNYQYNISQDNQGGYRIFLSKGTYTIKVLIISGDKNAQAEIVYNI